MRRKLNEMVVVITGASAGIGKSLAQQLAPRGVHLVLAARRMDRLEELNNSLGGKHLCVRTDVSVESECQILIERTMEHFGRIDTLVCNAGYGMIRKVTETDAEQMRQIFATNVFGTTDCIRFAVPHMLKQEIRDGYRGQVMIVSSAAARRGLPFFGPYSATKSAQLSLAEALRVELHSQRVAVTSVHPIGTDTDFFTTAESNSTCKMPGGFDYHQSAQTVARKMIHAIEHPRPELWPMRPARFALGIGSVAPGLVDRFMRRFVSKFEHSTDAGRREERG